jgi:hypothetical protein
MFNTLGANIMSTTVRRDTRAWQVQVWLSFSIAAFLCGTGLAWLPGHLLEQAFMVMGYVFSLSTVFALAKMLRDAHECMQAETTS